MEPNHFPQKLFITNTKELNVTKNIGLINPYNTYYKNFLFDIVFNEITTTVTFDSELCVV
jgi:hypothetical protein